MNDLRGFQIQHSCSDCEMQDPGFFCELKDTNLKVFESLKITNAYPKGTVLFMEGQPSNGVFILCQGKVKLSTCSKDGKVIILHIAEPGEVLGLSAAVTTAFHTATAEVIEPCQVNFVRNLEFIEFLRQNTEACYRALEQLSKNYNTAYLQICSLGLSSSVGDKLARLFLGWCKAAADGTKEVHIKMDYTHEELAEMIGSSRETVTRLLKAFKEKDLISIDGSDLVVHDTTKLGSGLGDS